MKCPKCQAENAETKQFCGDCGTQLAGRAIRVHDPDYPEAGPPSQKAQTGGHEPKSPADGAASPAFQTETLRLPVQELTTGSTFAGRYQVIEELGHGGMGKVYRVLDQKLDEEVALKLIRPEIAADKETIKRFHNELRLARKIAHRNVGKMYELMEDAGTHFITMEYVPGQDLRGLIRQMGQLTAGKAVSIARQVCEGLEEAHRLGVIHRDLKPGNILIDKDGNARIMDFGIARSLEGKGITGAGVMIGTPEYMSPEHVEGEDIDQRSDIYSLGVILYEMVTGRRPFEGNTPLSVAHKQKYEAPEDPRKLNHQLPEDLSRVILRCLQKDKEKRYQTAEELQNDLARLEEEIPTPERPIPKRKTTKAREIADGEDKVRWRKVALYGGAVVILALIIYAGIRLFAGRTEVIDSIAVLPFENVNADPNTDFLCDGITETIIIKLSRLSVFKTVINRASVFTYKRETVDPKKVGQELGVKAVLLTRMVRLGDQLTVSPTLVRTRDDSQLWGERYDRKFEDIHSIEESIVTSIVQTLRLKLTAQDQQKISARPIDNAAAYECYLKANYEIWSFRKEALDRAVKNLQNALDITGPNALLYSAMANAYRQYVNIGAGQEEDLARAEDYVKKALAIDPSSSQALVILAYVNEYRSEQDGIRYFKKALAANPKELGALRRLPMIYMDVGKPSLALPLIERYKKTDPLNPDNDLLQGYFYTYSGKFDLAVDYIRRWYQTDPENPQKQHMYAQALAYNKSSAEALSVIAQGDKANPNNTANKFMLLFKYGLLKDKERAFQIMTPDFRKTCRRDSEWSYIVADAFALLDEKTEALDWLENAVNIGIINYPFINKYDPLLENIRGEERFKKLMERVKYEWEHFKE